MFFRYILVVLWSLMLSEWAFAECQDIFDAGFAAGQSSCPSGCSNTACDSCCPSVSTPSCPPATVCPTCPAATVCPTCTDTNGSTADGITQCKSNPSSCGITAATLGITPDLGDGSEVDGIKKCQDKPSDCGITAAALGITPDLGDGSTAEGITKCKGNLTDCGITTTEVFKDDTLKNAIIASCKENPKGCGITTVELTEEIKKTLADNNKTVPKFETFDTTFVLYIPKVSLGQDISNLYDSACDVYMTAVNGSLFELKVDKNVPVVPCKDEVVPPTDNETNTAPTANDEVVPPTDNETNTAPTANDEVVQPTTIFKLMTVNISAKASDKPPITTVTSKPDGISCTTMSNNLGAEKNCTEEYKEGSKVTLTISGKSADFTYTWSDESCSKEITMDNDKICTLRVAKKV